MNLNYGSLLIYYCLDFVSASINAACSIVAVYPKLELGVKYLLNRGSDSYRDTVNKSRQRRDEQVLSFQEKRDQAFKNE